MTSVPALLTLMLLVLQSSATLSATLLTSQLKVASSPTAQGMLDAMIHRPLTTQLTDILQSSSKTPRRLITPSQTDLSWRGKRPAPLSSLSASPHKSRRLEVLETIKTHLSTLATSVDAPRRPPGHRKRSGSSSLCPMLGFPMSNACLQNGAVWARPDRRSVNAEERKWPSMYLLGGAVGR